MVVKVGTAVLTSPTGQLDTERVRHLVHQVHELWGRGIQSVVVTSGAISAGWHELGFESRPTAMPQLQASAAVGQGKLISIYDEYLHKLGRHAGQLLLTREDFENRKRYLNARNTIWALLDRGSIPIINENDTISVEEITFGDNDILSAQVTHLVQAEVLIILSTVDGLYRGQPAPGQKPQVVQEVESVSEAVKT
ncbi:MAG: glutamate 5-kinase, partial [Planctomycetes bacterium]|nr:glutamate 5-kinase [Planctomycetota bacterium]